MRVEGDVLVPGDLGIVSYDNTTTSALPLIELSSIDQKPQELGMIAADRIPFSGYHMPFPNIGYVEAQGDGFRYAPVSYQFDVQ